MKGSERGLDDTESWSGSRWASWAMMELLVRGKGIIFDVRVRGRASVQVVNKVK